MGVLALCGTRHNSPLTPLLLSSSSWGMAFWKVGAITLPLAVPSSRAFVTWPAWVPQSP